MNEQYKAKPTTFNGVLYRSKSEARLAVCFDSWGWDFSYETVSVGNWKADFTVISKDLITVIEYKPATPTENYMQELHGNFCKIQSAAKEIPSLKKMLNKRWLVCELWCVDFWNDISFGLRHNSNQIMPFENIDCELSACDFSPGKHFRFDLRSSSQEHDFTQLDLERIRRNANPS